MRAVLTGDMTFHHVGIVCSDASLLDAFVRLTGNSTKKPEVAFKHVPEFQCDCYLSGAIELVVPSGPSKDGTTLDRWLQGRGHSLHHIAFLVDDLEERCSALRAEGVPVVLDSAVDGVAGLVVNFVHPSYAGFLVELVQER